MNIKSCCTALYWERTVTSTIIFPALFSEKPHIVSLYQLILSDTRSVILQCRAVYVVVSMF